MSIAICIIMALFKSDDYKTRELGSKILTMMPWYISKDIIKHGCLHGDTETVIRCRQAYWDAQRSLPNIDGHCSEFNMPAIDGIQFALSTANAASLMKYCKLPFRTSRGKTIRHEAELLVYLEAGFKRARAYGVKINKPVIGMQSAGPYWYNNGANKPIDCSDGLIFNDNDKWYDFVFQTGSNMHFFAIIDNGYIVGGAMW